MTPQVSTVVPTRWLSRRAFAALVFAALVQAVLIVLAALNPWPTCPVFKLLTTVNLPSMLAGSSVALALMLAPVLAASPEISTLHIPARKESRQVGARALFTGCWLAATSLFFLLVASRLTPVESEHLLQAALVLAATATLAAAFAAFFPQAYTGLVFFWALALPFLAYLLTEMFLGMPQGALGWGRGTAPETLRLKSCVHALLEFSPGTAMVGLVQGHLPGGGEMGWNAALKFVAFCGLLSGMAVWVRRRWPAVTVSSSK